MIARSWSAVRPKKSRIPASMSRCWPVRQITVLRAGLAASALTTGAILIASGRVPNTVRIFMSRRGLSLGPASLPDQRIDPLRRIVGGNVGLAGLDHAAIPGVIATERRDPFRQEFRLVGDERCELGRQVEAFGRDRRHDAGDPGGQAIQNLALQTRTIAQWR